MTRRIVSIGAVLTVVLIPAPALGVICSSTGDAIIFKKGEVPDEDASMLHSFVPQLRQNLSPSRAFVPQLEQNLFLALACS